MYDYPTVGFSRLAAPMRADLRHSRAATHPASPEHPAAEVNHQADQEPEKPAVDHHANTV